jgi:hypothetical protein
MLHQLIDVRIIFHRVMRHCDRYLYSIIAIIMQTVLWLLRQASQHEGLQTPQPHG